MSLDEMDRKIIELLQEDAKMSAKEISGITGRPITTIYSRIKKLEESGVIKGYKATLDARKLDLSTTAFVLATADISKIDLKKYPNYSLGSEIAKFPQVQEVFLISGNWDYLIKIKERSTEAVGEFIVNKLNYLPGMEKTLTCLVFRNIKETLDLPIDIENDLLSTDDGA
ncbi:MAG TPA: Lrp/AsnC family transcriptional regulator [Patescibacteria group bacterium]|nr:Lrp/AsnC family transcriptional regulator [Patescibacteria group bacterium]